MVIVTKAADVDAATRLLFNTNKGFASFLLLAAEM